MSDSIRDMVGARRPRDGNGFRRIAKTEVMQQQVQPGQMPSFTDPAAVGNMVGNTLGRLGDGLTDTLGGMADFFDERKDAGDGKKESTADMLRRRNAAKNPPQQQQAQQQAQQQQQTQPDGAGEVKEEEEFDDTKKSFRDVLREKRGLKGQDMSFRKVSGEEEEGMKELEDAPEWRKDMEGRRQEDVEEQEKALGRSEKGGKVCNS